MATETFALWRDLSEAGRHARRLAYALDGVCAGTMVLGGRLERVNAGTLRALDRRRLVALSLSPDGGMMARLTDAGRALVPDEYRRAWRQR